MTDNNTVIGWVITSTESSSRNRIGYGQGMEDASATQQSFDAVVGRTIFMGFGLKARAIPSDKQVRWRSYSDDGDFAYAGVVNVDWLFDEDDSAYNIDRFCMEDWGAVIVLYNFTDIERVLREEGKDVPRFVTEGIERGSDNYAPKSKECWKAIYG
jgi:hypothetical protein